MRGDTGPPCIHPSDSILHPSYILFAPRVLHLLVLLHLISPRLVLSHLTSSLPLSFPFPPITPLCFFPNGHLDRLALPLLPSLSILESLFQPGQPSSNTLRWRSRLANLRSRGKGDSSGQRTGWKNREGEEERGERSGERVCVLQGQRGLSGARERREGCWGPRGVDCTTGAVQRRFDCEEGRRGLAAWMASSGPL